MCNTDKNNDTIIINSFSVIALKLEATISLDHNIKPQCNELDFGVNGSSTGKSLKGNDHVNI